MWSSQYLEHIKKNWGTLWPPNIYTVCSGTNCAEQPLDNLSAQNLLKELISALIRGYTRSDKTWWPSLTFRFPQSMPVQHHRGNLPQKVLRHKLREHDPLKIPIHFHSKAAHTAASEPSGEEASKQKGVGSSPTLTYSARMVLWDPRSFLSSPHHSFFLSILLDPPRCFQIITNPCSCHGDFKIICH